MTQNLQSLALPPVLDAWALRSPTTIPPLKKTKFNFNDLQIEAQKVSIKATSAVFIPASASSASSSNSVEPVVYFVVAVVVVVVEGKPPNGSALDKSFLETIWTYMLSCVRRRDMVALDICIRLARMEPTWPEEGGRFLLAALEHYPVDTLAQIERLVGDLKLIPTQAFIIELVRRTLNPSTWRRVATTAGWLQNGIPLERATVERIVDESHDMQTLCWLMKRDPWSAVSSLVIERLVTGLQQTSHSSPRWHTAAALCKQFKLMPSWPCVLAFLKAGRMANLISISNGIVIRTYHKQLYSFALDADNHALLHVLATYHRSPLVPLCAWLI